MISRIIFMFVLFFYTIFLQAQTQFSCDNNYDFNLTNMSMIQTTPLKVGQKTDFEEKYSAFDASIYKDKVVVFMFSATWCGWCHRDLIETEKWLESTTAEKSDVVFIHLFYNSSLRNVDPTQEDNYEKAKAFIDTPTYRKYSEDEKLIDVPLNISGSDFYFHNDLITNLFEGASGTPFGLIFDKKGKLQFYGYFTNGKMSTQQKFDNKFAYIEKLLNGECN